MNFRFASPILLIFLAFLPLLFSRLKHGTGTGAIRFSDLRILKRIKPSRMQRLRGILPWLRILGAACLILALARPQSGLRTEEVTTEGIDIMLALDTSGSMQAEDFKPNNRLFVAKQKVAEFIDGRKNDPIGLVVFARDAFTQCPLTLDYGVLLAFLEQANFAGRDRDGTAIGMALATSVNRLREAKAKSKVIVLLTDGANNAGNITPLDAAKAAKAFGVKVYTIAVGRPEGAMQKIIDPILGTRYVPGGQSDLDEGTLTKIAGETGGKFYRATDPDALENAYKEIDSLEKTEVKVKEFTKYSELFPWFAGFGFFLLGIEIVLMNTRFRKIP